MNTADLDTLLVSSSTPELNMCHAVLLFSDRELPLVDAATAIWLGIEPLPPRFQAVRAHVAEATFAYLAASHEGCGCGFYSNRQHLDDNEEYNQASRRALSEYLASQHASGRPTRMWLFGTWEDDDAPPERWTDVRSSEVAILDEPVEYRSCAAVLAG